MQNYKLFFKKQNSFEKFVYRWRIYGFLWCFLCPYLNAYMNALHKIYSLAVFGRFQTLSSPWWYNPAKNKKEALKTPLFPLRYAYFSHLKYILVLSVILGKIRAPTKNVS